MLAAAVAEDKQFEGRFGNRRNYFVEMRMWEINYRYLLLQRLDLSTAKFFTQITANSAKNTDRA